MRHFLSTLIFTILLIGCQSNPSTDIEAQEAAGSTLAIELPCDSRLQFGDKYNNLYPLYWTELDYIYANSKPSSQIVIDKENPSCAKFEFSEVLEYPLAINYEFYHAELPNSNPFSSTSIAFFLSYFEPMQKEWGENGEFVRPNMYAYTESPKNAIELKHLAGVLRFAIKGDKEGRTLDRIEVTSQSGSYLSGYFVINEIFKALAPEYQLSSRLITPYDDLEDTNVNNSSTTLI